MKEIAEKFQKFGVVPVVVLEDTKDAVPLAKALVEGGLPCAEVTFRTEAAEESIRIMAALTSIVLLAPVIGPLAGAGLMNFLHWKLLFAIIGAMSLLASSSNSTSSLASVSGRRDQSEWVCRPSGRGWNKRLKNPIYPHPEFLPIRDSQPRTGFITLQKIIFDN